jgi:predicted DNA-binding transcriptional regulator AlpA
MAAFSETGKMSTGEMRRRALQRVESHRQNEEERQQRRRKTIIRPREAWHRLGISRSTFYDEFVSKGRVKLIPLTERARGVVDAELDDLIEKLIADRDHAMS